uniref:helix-turn-helix domain-containing protein n=2 Tax=Rhodococcus TaxID=1827 RepID=UPI00396A0959
MAAGEFITDAAEAAGSYRKQGARWLAACGGVCPRRGRNLKGRCLTFAEREEIAISIAAGHTLRDIATTLNRSPSTISREIARNREPSGRYRARSAHAAAYHRALRPKPSRTQVVFVAARRHGGDLQALSFGRVSKPLSVVAVRGAVRRGLSHSEASSGSMLSSSLSWPVKGSARYGFEGHCSRG